MQEPSVSRHVGVNLSQDVPKEVARKGKKIKRCWSRTMMEFATSPYFVTKDILIVKEAVRGDRMDVDHLFR